MARKAKVAAIETVVETSEEVKVEAPIETSEEVKVEAPIETSEEVKTESEPEAEPKPVDWMNMLMAGEEKPKTKVEKNQGVGTMVKKLIGEGLTNTEILKIVHEAYGNKQTTYACIAWYRNRMKKAGQIVSTKKAVETVEKFLATAPDGEVEESKTETEAEGSIETDTDDGESEILTADELRQMVGQ